MTWLLHKLQKILRLLGGGRSNSPVSKSTQLGSEIASRLQSSKAVDDSDPVAVRVRGGTHKPAAPIQSTAPLRQKNSSVLKDTVDPIADAPDTHQRLDAAPASLPGGMPAAPRFPTEVSDLISSQSTQPSALKDDLHDGLPVPVISPETDNEQLPEIHDLLPAVEPDSLSNATDAELEHEQDEAAIVVEKSSVENSSDVAEGPVSIEGAGQISDAPVVESAQRVSAVDQATLFSFDIIEADSNVGDASCERTDQAESEHIELASYEISSDANVISEQGIADTQPAVGDSVEDVQTVVKQPSQLDLPIVKALIPDSLLDDLSARKIDEQKDGGNEQVDAEGAGSATVLQPDSVKSSLPKDAKHDASADGSQNPWLTAVPRQRREKLEENSQETVIKTGTVKLLFKLKQGNFHGYISPEDGTKDILFHQKYINSEIFEHLDRGTQVVVTAKYIAGKAYATRVDVLQE